MTFPDFIGIGAQKAGTTWLQRNLQAHPEIWMPQEKELHYFDEKMKERGWAFSRLLGTSPADKRWRRQLSSRFKRASGDRSTQALAWDFKYFFGRPGDGWYASLFEQGRGKITGETTPDYAILDEETIAHVHGLMPEAKIIFMMRNPVERPWSAMDMRLRIRGQEVHEVKDRKFYRRFDNKGSRSRTDYLRTLESWGAFYPPERIFVGFLEDVRFFPRELLRALYSFLGVNPSFEPPLSEKKIHSGHRDTIPTRFAVHLARTYLGEIKELHERFGGYASFWLYCAERLAEAPPEEESIAYPFWESLLWEEWERSRGLTMQSGPLSSVRAAS
ncbi:MAG TPA: sulfotransferase [Rubrobacteraceae bacterium]|nr:sulfotransferase [Rubrobacteraceae bacterium]